MNLGKSNRAFPDTKKELLLSSSVVASFRTSMFLTLAEELQEGCGDTAEMLRFLNRNCFEWKKRQKRTECREILVAVSEPSIGIKLSIFMAFQVIQIVHADT
ncbi:hypothetical protein ACLOJK_031851 [Asimina triloba]